MTATSSFFFWFFNGLGGLGGWFIFLLFAAAAVVWMLYDSSRRRLPALGWKTGVILSALLILPAIIFRFSGVETQVSLQPFVEAIFYLGILAGILPVILDIGYYVTFQGLMGCAQGHVYESRLGQCPECARAAIPPVMRAAPVVQAPPPPREYRPEPAAPSASPVPQRPKAQAWLVAGDGRSYQLNSGETTIGRTSNNDIQVASDTTVSRQHAKIIEQNGHFRIMDLGSKSGTRVNDRLLRAPEMLEPDDEVCLGDNTVFHFVTARR